jgi:Trk K+ transport system NAD-binding subunit
MGQKGIIVGHDLSTPVERSVETLSRQSYSRVYARSLWKGRDVFEQFPDLLAVAIIRDQRVELPRGSTRLQPKDQLLIVTNETKNLDAFIRLASRNVNKAG